MQIVPSHAESCLVTRENGWPSPIGLPSFAALFETGTFRMSPQSEAVLPRLTGLFPLRATDCHMVLSLPMKMHVWLTEAAISDMSPPAQTFQIPQLAVERIWKRETNVIIYLGGFISRGLLQLLINETCCTYGRITEA